MLEMEIKTNGRTLVDKNIHEIKPGRIVSEFTYDDGTVFKFIQEAGKINVDCNKSLKILPDGKTIEIL